MANPRQFAKSGSYVVAWGMGLGMTGTGVGKFRQVSANFGKEAGVWDEHADAATGDTDLLIVSDVRKTVTADVIPGDTTLANAKAANLTPEIGAIVTVTDSTEAAGGDYAGSYHVRSVSKRASAKGVVTITMNLIKFANTLVEVSA